MKKGRASRIIAGWSANFVQVLLGIVQQIALVPVFLHFWASDVFAAWLALFSVGYFILVADFGLQMRAINRFLALRAGANCDDRTARYFASMLWVYLGIVAIVIAILLIGTRFVSPSHILGFSVAHFDDAFLIMTIGMIATLPTNLASALYRAHGLYGRAVRIQCWGLAASQVAQMAGLALTQSLFVVAVGFVSTQIVVTVYFLHDMYGKFPFLKKAQARFSTRWTIGQFRRAFPFAVVLAAENLIVYAPVLLVSAFVTDRVAVAQWGLTRVIAGLARALSFQVALPLAAEMGHDYVSQKYDELRQLYARGSALLTLLAAFIGAGIISFWPDFFALWTHNTIPDDPVLTAVLVIGNSVVAPSILALSYANYTDRGPLLAWTKGLQLVLFLLLSFALIPVWGALGAALAICLSDILVQFAFLAIPIMKQTLARPMRHIVFLVSIVVIVTAAGWAIGAVITNTLPLLGLAKFVVECGLWLAIMGMIAAPAMRRTVRDRVIAIIPR